jgi:Kef-type K+ transport system membrane component KefB
MSITAFPVLARILSERRMQATPVGATALTCAAIGDATAWCLLALFIGVAQARVEEGLLTAYLTVGYVVVMFAVVRPLMTRFVRRNDGEKLSEGVLAVAVAGMLVSALTTELIGIHAIFGAFLMGVIIPHDTTLARRIIENLEGVIVVVLLPAFFVFTGLRTQVGLIADINLWLICGLLIVVACLGKFGGTFFAARFAGLGWRESAVLGTLMNTRGLMELIVLNIGLDLKIISPVLFAMLVIMALVTTFLTTPVVDALTAGDRRL